MNISEQSVFGIYDQAENQVTSALLKIFEADENETILNAMLQDIAGTELPEKSLKIETQPENSEGKSRPDGKLSCRYAFVRNQVYTTYDKIMNAKKTSDLK